MKTNVRPEQITVTQHSHFALILRARFSVPVVEVIREMEPSAMVSIKKKFIIIVITLANFFFTVPFLCFFIFLIFFFVKVK